MNNKEFLKAVEDNSLRLSFTSLSKLDKSPRHFRDFFTTEFNETPAMRVGSLVHTLILEPELFTERYIIAPKIDKRTKVGKEAYNAFILASEGKTVITESEYEQALVYVQGVKECKAARWLLRAAEKVEQKLSFQHKGLTIRGIRDLEHPDFVADLKTTADASPKAFYWSVKKYLYNMQAAIYTYNCNRPYYIIAVEKSGQCAVYSLTEETIQEGRNKFEELVKKYRSCRLSGAWNESYGYDGGEDGILSI